MCSPRSTARPSRSRGARRPSRSRPATACWRARRAAAAISARSTSADRTSFSTTAPPGAYFVRVLATNPCGQGAPSAEAVAVVGGAPRAAGTGVRRCRVGPIGSTVSLEWAAPSVGHRALPVPGRGGQRTRPGESRRPDRGDAVVRDGRCAAGDLLRARARHRCRRHGPCGERDCRGRAVEEFGRLLRARPARHARVRWPAPLCPPPP